MEYKEENDNLKTRLPAIKHKKQITTTLNKRHDNKKKAMAVGDGGYMCTIHLNENTNRRIEE